MKKYEALIFATGAITLALELLASRIMTPYFGVSLYIWSGILSITLTFLAIGYRWGGHLSASLSAEASEFLILATPVASAAAIAIATLAYPIAFPALSQLNLIFGSFVGATVLLALPLIALSALNPLLIGLQASKSSEGDSGAGRIFFISTIGSVLGVLCTAFVFIPNITNFRAVLMLGMILCAASLILVFVAKNVSPVRKRSLIVASLIVVLACGTVSAGKSRYLEFVNRVASFGKDLDMDFTVLAEYTSMFGNIKVAEVRKKEGSGQPQRLFIQDGMIQNYTDLQNTSLTPYTYVLEILAHSFEPEAKDALILGLGAGIVPLDFKRAGMNVSVVEINPSALKAATEHFGFDPTGIEIHLEDARTFVRTCHREFDVAIVDLFAGDNIPDYLPTKEFFGDLKRCIRPNGSVVMNAFFDDGNDAGNTRFLATVGDAFPKLFLARLKGSNTFVVGTRGKTPKRMAAPSVDIPRKISKLVVAAASEIHRVPKKAYSNAEPISDDHNIFSVIYSDSNMLERQLKARSVPPAILVN